MDQESIPQPEVSSVLPNPKNHLGWRDLLKLSVRAFRVRPMRTFLTILGMSVGIGTVFFLISLGYGFQNILLGRLAPNEDVLQSIEIYYPGEGGVFINEAMSKEIAIQDNVSEIAPIMEVPGEVVYNGLSGTVLVKIITPNYFRLSGFQSDFGESEIGKDGNGIIISNTALKLLNLSEDDSALKNSVLVNAMFQQDGREDSIRTIPSKKLLPIIGIIKDETQAPYILVSSDALTEPPTIFTKMFVKINSLDNFEAARSYFIQQGFLISAKIDTVSQARKITTAVTVTLAVFGVAALIVSAIGMFNTMLISFMERIFEVGIMKSIGATQRDILNLFIMESFVMGLLGGVGGIVLGFGIGQLVNVALNFLARYLGGKPVTLFFYPYKFIILVIILSSVVGVLAGFWPARKAAKLSARQAFLRK